MPDHFVKDHSYKEMQKLVNGVCMWNLKKVKYIMHVSVNIHSKILSLGLRYLSGLKKTKKVSVEAL